MLENLDGLEPNDVARVSVSMLNHWNKSDPIRQINSKVRSVNPLLKLSRSKTSSEAEKLAGSFLKKCVGLEDVDEDSLIEAVRGLCSGQCREEAWSGEISRTLISFFGVPDILYFFPLN